MNGAFCGLVQRFVVPNETNLRNDVGAKLAQRKEHVSSVQVLAAQLQRQPKKKRQRHNAKFTRRKKRRDKLAVRSQAEWRFLRSGATPCCAERNQHAARRRDQTCARQRTQKMRRKYLQHQLQRQTKKPKQRHNAKFTRRKKRRDKLAVRR